MGRDLDITQKVLKILVDFDTKIMCLDSFRIIQHSLEFIQEKIDIYRSSIALFEGDKKRFRLLDAIHALDVLKKGASLPLESTVLSEVIQGTTPFYRRDIREEKTTYKVDEYLLNEGIRSDFLIPLIAENRCLGTLNCGSVEVDGIPEEKRQLLILLSSRLAPALLNAQLFEALKNRERALNDSEDKYRQLFSTESDAILIFDAKTLRFIDVNNAALDLYGYSRDDFLKLTLLDISTEPEKTIASVAKTADGKVENIPLRYHRKRDGTIFPAEISPGSFMIKNSKVVCGIVRDITGRKQAEKKLIDYQEQLRALASQLSIAEEQERKRIASELHDHIGQTLLTLKLRLEELQESNSSVSLEKQIGNCLSLVEQIYHEARSLTVGLNPPVLYELGFIEAVEWLARNFREEHGITVILNDDGNTKTIDDDIKFLLFRTINELLVNVVRHAQASKVTIITRTEGDTIMVTVKDDGIGMELDSDIIDVYRTKGYGLFSIRERMIYLGGNIEIDSRPGQGTRITLVVPFKHGGETTKEGIL